MIGDGAFYRCESLTSVTIPPGVTSIGNDAFMDCLGLTSVVIPDGVTSIGSFAFGGCSGMISITIPSSVTSMELMSIPGPLTVFVPKGSYAEKYCSRESLLEVRYSD